jgi:hypothetical protein
MGLVEQNQSFKFAGGVETKMDSKAVPPVRLLGLENGVFSKAISIKKRNGYDLLSRAVEGVGIDGDGNPTGFQPDPISNARCLARRGDELLLFTNNNCYSKQSDADLWTDAGAVISAPGYDRPAMHTGSAQTTPDHATNNGVTVYAWEDSLGGVWWTSVDAVSGRIYRAPTQANASGQRPCCVPVGEVLHIYYAVPTQRNVSCVIVNPSAPSAPVTPQIVIDDLDTTNPVYDACRTERAGNPAVIVWHEHATSNYRVGYVAEGGVLGSPAAGMPSVYRETGTLRDGSPIAVAFKNVDGGDGDRIFVAFVLPIPSGPPSMIGGEPLLGGLLATYTGGDATTPITFGHIVSMHSTASDVLRCAVAEADDVAWTVFEENAAQTSNHYCVASSSAVDSDDFGIPRELRSVTLATRAFQAGNDADVFAVFIHNTTYFNTYLTLRLSDFAPVGRQLPGSASAPARTHVASVHVVDNVATVSLPYKTRLQSSRNDKFTETGIRRVVMEFDSDDSHQYAQLGAGLYLGGACPQHYDGRLWTEQGFHVGPEYITHTLAGGSLTPVSTYEYIAWYEWTDGQGEIHRGPTSVGYTVTTGSAEAAAEVTFALPTLRVTRKTNVRICVARCLPGDTSRFFRVTSLDPTTAGNTNGYVANDPTVDSVSFTDNMSDTNLQLEEPLYTTGGILSNDPAAVGAHIAASKNRVFFTDANNGNVVRYSQTIANGYGLEVAPELKLDVPPDGGDVTALSVMDDVVFVFKQNAVYAFAGDGPFATGTTTNAGPTVSGFTAPQKIPGAAVGCTDPKSIAVTQQGIMFRSGEQGIWRVGIDRQLQYTGSAVEIYNTQTVRRALPMPNRTAVLFLTDSGKTLYYDYLFDQWSTFTNHEGLDAVVVDDAFYYLRTNDVVFKETPGEYADGNARIILRFETAWLHMHEHLQGFQRFWKLLLLGTWSSPHQLGVQYRKDYDEAWSEPYYLDATGDTSAAGWITGDSANTIGADSILGSNYGDGNYGDGVYGGTGPQVYQWRYGIHEDGESIQFRFEDFEKAGLAGASFELTEMTIVGGIMKPDNRPFAASRST